MTFNGTSRYRTLLLMLGFTSLFGFVMAASTWGQAPAGAGAEAKKIPFPMPNSHKGNWLQYHGASADLTMNEAGSKGKACYVCHERSECMECHNTMMPKDHTNTWRTLSHGFQAAGNRDRCQNCHRQDYCVRCHNETAPRTHTANWRSRHCTWCHYGSSLAPDDNCAVCHNQALHPSAPHPVSPTATCIQTGCHL